jgi:hypothetical protein
MNKKRIRDIKGVISRQKRYATLAKKEGDYAAQKATEEKSKGLMEMYKDSMNEKHIAYQFAKKRKRIVSKMVKKLPQENN